MSEVSPEIRLLTGSSSLVGQVRSANEDSILVTEDLVAVADGMGGHRAGEVASADTVEVLATVAGRRTLIDLVAAVHLANRRINDRADEDEDLRGMGTTVCVVGLVDEDGDHLAVLNVGDSRVYLYAAGELRQLTEDHSLVETLVREGRITPEEAEVHPQRNVLTRALGVEALVVVDAWLLDPCDGDRLLLCSDGLFNELSEDRIAELLGDGDDPQVTAQRLAAEADAAGGRDNISTIVVEVQGSGRPASPLGNRSRRIATPTVDLDDAFRDSEHDTATVPLVPISAAATPAPVVDDDGSYDERSDDPTDGDVPAGDDQLAGEPGIGAEDDAPAFDPALLSAPAVAGGDASAGDDTTAGDDDSGRSTRRSRSWRTPLFVFAVLMIVAVAVGAVLYQVGDGWYVGTDDDQVVLYEGRPSAVLWRQPVVAERFDIDTALLSAKDRADLAESRKFASESKARTYIGNIERRATTTTTTTTTTTMTTTTTTTTVPPEVLPTDVPPATDVPPPA